MSIASDGGSGSIIGNKEEDNGDDEDEREQDQDMDKFDDDQAKKLQRLDDEEQTEE